MDPIFVLFWLFSVAVSTIYAGSKIVEWWWVGMVVVMVLIVTIRRMRGFAFNAWFGPVIVLGGWAVSLATEHQGVTMWWSLVVVAALSWAATLKPASATGKKRRR